MEYLDRGVVATRSSATQVFVSWRSLAFDSPSMLFNVYRSSDGGAPIKLNPSPITGGTNYTDSSANLAISNTYTIRSVLNNVESTTDGSYTLPANSVAGPLIQIPLRNLGDYSVRHISVADLDGDGKFDYIVGRKPAAINEIATQPEIIEAYNSNGTFLWAVSAGPNSFDLDNVEPGASAIDVGNWDGVTAYDLDSDGYAEVLYRSANGVIFGDGKALSYPGSNNIQFVSVIDGRTGAEKARIQVPTDYVFDGSMGASFGIGYLDGVHPSLVAKFKNRIGGGDFNQMFVAYDYNGTAITQRWKQLSASADSDNGHNIRLVDVDGDGKDELADTDQVLNPNGTIKYNLRNGNPAIGHGDRFHIGDFDPVRPGLEGYGVQQNNPSGLFEYYYDAATGEILHAHYTTPPVDYQHGSISDIDPSYPGFEYWSFGGVYNSTTTVPGQAPVETKLTDDPNRPWPDFTIWWDGDVLGENLDETHVDKWNPVTQTVNRLTTLYHYGSPNGNVTPFLGDIFGDWREEVIFENTDHLSLDIYTTQYASSIRLYTLAEDPEYRNCMTVKGYTQSNALDYYLGFGMSTPPTPNIQVLPKATGPFIATSAVASATVTSGRTINLAVLGSDDSGETGLTYTWSALGPAAVVYSLNGNNAAKNTTAAFFAAGTYIFTVSAQDTGGLAVLSNVTVTVNQVLSRLIVTPATANAPLNSTLQFMATGYDQFGAAMPAVPSIFWAVSAGGGTISGTGLYTPPNSAGNATIQATCAAVTAAATIAVTGPGRNSPSTLNATAMAVNQINLTWSDIAGEAGYWLEMSTDNLTFRKIGTTNANVTSFIASGLNAHTTYYFRVRGVNAAGGGVPSATASAMTFALPFAWFRLDESSGTTANDGTGFGPPGYVSGATFAAGRSGNALSFNSAKSDYSQLPNDTMSTAAGAASFWVKTGTNFSDDAMVFYFSSDTYGNGEGSQYELHVNFTPTEKLEFFIEGGATDVSIISSGSYANGTWHHVVATWDMSANAVLYVDGAVVGSVTDDSILFPNSQRTFLGRPNIFGTRHFNGLIDDVRLFSTSITAAQVSSLFSAAAATNSAPTIVSPAAAAASAFTAPAVALIALGSDDSGEPNLSYTWSLLSGPAPVNFGVNGTNAAKDSSAYFSYPGTYALKVTITDPNGASTTSTTSVTFSPLSGDANFDGNIDLGDYDMWYSHVGATPNGPATGDFNLDANIDLGDYDVWYAHVGSNPALITDTAPSVVQEATSSSHSISSPSLESTTSAVVAIESTSRSEGLTTANHISSNPATVSVERTADNGSEMFWAKSQAFSILIAKVSSASDPETIASRARMAFRGMANAAFREILNSLLRSRWRSIVRKDPLDNEEWSRLPD